MTYLFFMKGNIFHGSDLKSMNGLCWLLLRCMYHSTCPQIEMETVREQQLKEDSEGISSIDVQIVGGRDAKGFQEVSNGSDSAVKYWLKNVFLSFTEILCLTYFFWIILGRS